MPVDSNAAVRITAMAAQLADYEPQHQGATA